MDNKRGRLEQLKIAGFKSIKNLEIELKPLNILIGANGVGKSNFINFFKFMKKLLDEDLQLYVAEQGGANKLLHFGRKNTEELSFTLFFPPNGYQCTLVPDVKDSLIFKKERSFYKEYNYKPTIHDLADSGAKESLLNSSRQNIEKYIVRYIQDWKIYHFHDTSVNATIKQTCHIGNCDILEPDGGNLSAFLRNIRENNEKSYQQIVKTIQRVAPFFHDFILKPEINNKDTIKLKWKHKGTDKYFDAHDLSDGTLRFICLTTLLLQPNLPTIIILDEPELGLHPFALTLLASMFRKIAKKTQIIAATQSVTLADNFDIEDIIVVDRENNQSVFKRLDKGKYQEWLEEYSVGEIWQKNLMGGMPNYDD